MNKQPTTERVPARTYGMKIPAPALEWLHHQARMDSVQQRQHCQVCDLIRGALVKQYGQELATLLAQK